MMFSITFDLRVHSQTFSCYAFAIKKLYNDCGCLRQICLNANGARRGVALVLDPHASVGRFTCVICVKEFEHRLYWTSISNALHLDATKFHKFEFEVKCKEDLTENW